MSKRPTLSETLYLPAFTGACNEHLLQQQIRTSCGGVEKQVNMFTLSLCVAAVLSFSLLQPLGCSHAGASLRVPVQ